MKKFVRHSRSGFTLVELLISMTIISIMGAMTILVYFSVTENSRRLQMTREISETARQITERISAEVRENGIDLSGQLGGTSTTWRQDFLKEYNQTQDGKWSTVLPIKKKDPNDTNEKQKFFVYGKKTTSGALEKCDYQTDNSVKCWLYIVQDGNTYNLVDSFRADESTKRVRITDLKFYITGGDYDANKVVLKMTLELAPGVGVPDSLIHSSKMEVQTTFSERPYKIE